MKISVQCECGIINQFYFDSAFVHHGKNKEEITDVTKCTNCGKMISLKLLITVKRDIHGIKS
jgi:hypothetical protein